MTTLRDVINVVISIVLLGFIANSLFHLGIFVWQTYLVQ